MSVLPYGPSPGHNILLANHLGRFTVRFRWRCRFPEVPEVTRCHRFSSFWLREPPVADRGRRRITGRKTLAAVTASGGDVPDTRELLRGVGRAADGICRNRYNALPANLDTQNDLSGALQHGSGPTTRNPAPGKAVAVRPRLRRPCIGTADYSPLAASTVPCACGK
jgi:hypothetical protein